MPLFHRRLTPFALALLGLLALAPPPFAATQAPEAPAAGPASLAGQLLVAAPGIGDPRFAETVIYLVRHTKDGALGLVVNRSIGERPLAEILQATNQDATGVTGAVRVFAGGPVEPGIGFVLHSADYSDGKTIKVDDRFAVTTSPSILADIAKGQGPKQALVIFGYAGWGPGQLEGELKRHDWLLAPADAALLFDADRDTAWKRALANRTMDL